MTAKSFKGEGQVRVVLLQEEKELYLAVANNYEQAPDLSALAKKGYTTKGSGHGTGLTSYRRIVTRCRGCAARTCLKDGMFIQELPGASSKIAAVRSQGLHCVHHGPQ